VKFFLTATAEEPSPAEHHRNFPFPSSSHLLLHPIFASSVLQKWAHMEKKATRLSPPPSSPPSSTISSTTIISSVSFLPFSVSVFLGHCRWHTGRQHCNWVSAVAFDLCPFSGSHAWTVPGRAPMTPESAGNLSLSRAPMSSLLCSRALQSLRHPLLPSPLIAQCPNHPRHLADHPSTRDPSPGRPRNSAKSPGRRALGDRTPQSPLFPGTLVTAPPSAPEPPNRPVPEPPKTPC
jgi:hypothetical protein